MNLTFSQETCPQLQHIMKYKCSGIWILLIQWVNQT
uniref:Uncharacterized protein n=1 Tax=Rhizophora mucronata TaxID=61149 RepID=A0A2P2NC40_RHIMU